MDDIKGLVVDSPIGKQEIDSAGSPVGVARMDVDESYAGVGELLQDYINHANQVSWDKIAAKIDYTYDHLDLALGALEKETALGQAIKPRLEKGQKLLFKPNIVIVQNIDPQTHGPTPMSTACTEWPFIAALMRWFHEKLDVSYYQMSLGEAGTGMPAMAGQFSRLHPDGDKVTVEAALEGRSGNFYGGWGFYFIRKYLSERLGTGAKDDPMAGYDESVAGTYIPPGLVSDKLMIYDLNRIFDDPTKGRRVKIPDGVNYESIMLHKAIVGGDPADSEDIRHYPGCILVNVPKYKVHAITLFTNIIKNLGIGLYPMQYAEAGGHQWDYSVPHNAVPGMKGGIPHEVWVPELDFETGLPKRDREGNYMVKKTGGITATMIDIIQAVRSQNIFMIHVVDGIEAINADHTGTAAAVRTPEGVVFAGLDPVAADLLCARYMFSNVPVKEAVESRLDDGAGGYFPQEVPIPRVEGNDIISETGYDCPLARDDCFRKAEERGLGKRAYYVVGRDGLRDSPLVSLQGHLGTIGNRGFEDLITESLYYDLYKIPWDMQRTAFSYLDAVDKLEGTSLKKAFLEAFDENGDGIVTYEEFGRKGAMGAMLYTGGASVSDMATEEMWHLKRGFSRTSMLKYSDPNMNPEGHDVFKDLVLGTGIVAAFRISQMEFEAPDPFLPGLTFGRGKWPSFQLARFLQVGMMLYGEGFPNKAAFPSFYGAAFFWADHTQNGGRYAGDMQSEPDPDALDRYFSDLSSGQRKPLDFIFYVPEGYDNLSGNIIPNVEVTSDPNLILTASFAGGNEIWPE